MKTLTKEKLRKIADNLLQVWAKKFYKVCLVCGEPLYCGHHFVHKSSSNALRYHLANIIPICKKCHCLVHSQPHLVEPKICFKLGEFWYNSLMEIKKTRVKTNKAWYEEQVEILKIILGKVKKVATADDNHTKRIRND